MKILNLIANQNVTDVTQSKLIYERAFRGCELFHQNIYDFSFDLSSLEDKDYLIFNLGAQKVSNDLFGDGLVSLLACNHGFIYCPPFYRDRTNTHNENYDLSDIAIISSDITKEKIAPEIAEIFTLDGLILNAKKLRNYTADNNFKSPLKTNDVLAFVKASIKANDFMLRRAALFIAEKRMLLGSKSQTQECAPHKLQTFKTHHENHLYLFPKLELNLEELDIDKNTSGLLYLSKHFSGYGTPEISIAHRDILSIVHYNLIWHLVRQDNKQHKNLAIKLAKQFNQEKTIYSVRPELEIIQKLLVSTTPNLASELFNTPSKDLSKTVLNNAKTIEILLDTVHDMNRISELSTETMLDAFAHTSVKHTQQKLTVKASMKQLIQSIKASLFYRLLQKEK